MKKKKHWSDMTSAELAEATKEYDREFVADEGKPLTEEDRVWLKRSAAQARKRGRPKVGKGSEKINITIERELLKKADALARRTKIGRSELIARGLAVLIHRKSA